MRKVSKNKNLKETNLLLKNSILTEKDVAELTAHARKDARKHVKKILARIKN